MSNLIGRLRRATPNADDADVAASALARGDLGLNDYAAMVAAAGGHGIGLGAGYGGNGDGLGGSWGTGTPIEQADDRFRSLVDIGHRQHGIVGALVLARALIMSQVTPVWRNTALKTTFGNRALQPLQRPDFYTRPHLFMLAEMHASYAGTAFFCRQGNGTTLLPPDRTRFVVGTNSDLPDDATETDVSLLPDARVLGYAYKFGKGARWTPDNTQYFDTAEVAAWMPEPDPGSRFRGQSWVGAVLREILQDRQVSGHVQKFFDKAATPNMVVTYKGSLTDTEFEQAQAQLESQYGGAHNAYRTMLLAGGAEVEKVGSTLEALSLKDVTGGFESRIAARSRVPATIAGIREGMEGSALNSGNYDATRRMFGDGWVSPTIQGLMATLEPLLELPAGGDSQLWYDRDEILFLQEDAKDAAEITKAQAVSLNQLIAAGFDPDAAVAATKANNLALLANKHIGAPANGTTEPTKTPGDT